MGDSPCSRCGWMPLQSTRKREAQDISATIRDLATAVQSEPDNPRLLHALAEAYQRDGRTSDALRQLDRIIDIGAATATTWKQTGQLLTNVGEYAQSLGAYQRGVELDACDTQAFAEAMEALYREIAGSA